MSLFNLGKLRIGAKLGISAGVGVVLVVGMIAIGQLQNASRDAAAVDIKSSFEMRAAIATFELTTRRLLIANRDLRFAANGKESDDVIGRIKAMTTEGQTQLGRLAALGTHPDIKGEVARIGELYKTYTTALAEIGT